ncbi:serine/threonine-protein kinase [Haliangium ochraceum]|nr:serine/threonine-protein kinase [Haliangium ochraceum]
MQAPFLAHGSPRDGLGGTAPTQTPSRGEPTRVLQPGTVIAGLYRIDDLLGTGGMGQVYAATQLLTGVHYALKVCHPGIPAEILDAEVRALEAVLHPGIVRVHATGSHEGIPFLIMERIYGSTLRQHLHEAEAENLACGRAAPRMPVERVISILASIADALAVLHEHGFVHRDLKPSNIMLTSDDRPVLLDLGVSCQSIEAEHERRLAGSPHYIAPEVITASIAKHQAPCIDIYALGVIAFEMLTGARPFDSHTQLDPLRQQLHAVPPRVSELVAEVPQGLEHLIEEMLRKEADERPRSARVVAARLRALQHAANATRLVRNARRRRPSMRRRRVTESVVLSNSLCGRPTLPPRPMRRVRRSPKAE